MGFIVKLGRRFWFFLRQPVYRRVLFYRFFLAFLRFFNPHIKYIGLRIRETNLLFFADDKAITLHALADGFFHEQELADVLTLLKQYSFPMGGAFFDIGANIGTTSLAAAKSGQFNAVYAFEPVQENAQLIHAHIALNPLATPITVIQNAISSENKITNMWRSKINYGDNRLVISGEENEENFGQCLEKVTSVTLDDFCAAKTMSPDSISLFWVDTQGLEAHVLKGAQAILKESKVPWLIEFWPSEMKRNGSYQIFMEMVTLYFRAFMDPLKKTPHPIEQLSAYEETLKGLNDFCNLLLLPK